ncbi:potassium ion channel protein, putative, partial [Bodo saltans]
NRRSHIHMHRTHGSCTNFGGHYRSLTPHASVNDVTLTEEMRGSLFCDPRNNTTSVPIFTHDGGLNADVEGVSQLQFQKLTWFYSLLSISWGRVVLLSGALYMSVVLAFAMVYYGMCWACGAKTTVIGSLYFVVVSISANGGYMGEDIDVLYPGHRCFAQRTYLVMVASYAGILIGALIATTFIAKISMHNKLQHRIVFSDYMTLTQTEMESYVLSFRVANISSSPMVHGRLRLYLVSLKPGPEQRAALNSGVFPPQSESPKTQRRKSLLTAPKPSQERRPTIWPEAAAAASKSGAAAAPIEISLPIPDDTMDATALEKGENSKLLAAMRVAATGAKSPALSYGSTSPASTLPGGNETGGGAQDIHGAAAFDGGASDDSNHSIEGEQRVTPMFMCVEELPWCCDEEI